MFKRFFLPAFLLGSLTWASEPDDEIHTFSKSLMGTEVIIKVDARNSESLNKAVKDTFAEGARLNMIFSDYETQSEVSRFSKTSGSGKYFPLSPELYQVLEHSQNLSRLSGGAFDVSLGSLSRLWRIARFQNKLPDESKLSLAKNRTGYRKIVLNQSSRSGCLLGPGMVLDLGGVAKGFIADQMMRKMTDSGYPSCLIDAGGDLAIGHPPGKTTGWRVRIGGKKHHDLPVLELSNCAVATSGDIEQFLEVSGKRFSHLINPHTGYGTTGGTQATIIAPNCMLADSLASTCLSLGFEKSKNLLEQTKFIALYFLSQSSSSSNLRVIERSK